MLFRDSWISLRASEGFAEGWQRGSVATYVLPKTLMSSAEATEVLDLIGGADADRTRDLLNAIQALSQLSYSPTRAWRFS